MAIARSIHRNAKAEVRTCAAGPLGPHEILCPKCLAHLRDEAEAERSNQ
jgi:hypothetical protein